MSLSYNITDNICAISSPPGTGGISVLRISGNKSISTINNLFSKDLIGKQSHTVHFGNIMDKENIIDEYVVKIPVLKNVEEFYDFNLGTN